MNGQEKWFMGHANTIMLGSLKSLVNRFGFLP
jgi:hypothetical protein